jgi:hypothetical protein
MADILLDRIALEVGEGASDEEVLAAVQKWLDPVQLLRGGKIDLVALLARQDHYEAEYLARKAKEK